MNEIIFLILPSCFPLLICSWFLHIDLADFWAPLSQQLFVDSLEYFMVKMISANDANDFLLLPFQVGCLFFFFHLKNLSVCACVCLGECESMEVKGQLLGVGYRLPVWVLGIELRSGLYAKCFYPQPCCQPSFSSLIPLARFSSVCWMEVVRVMSLPVIKEKALSLPLLSMLAVNCV